MPAPLKIDRAPVKAYAQAHGLVAAAEKFGLLYGTVKAWSYRDPLGRWGTKPPRAALKTGLEVAVRQSPDLQPPPPHDPAPPSPLLADLDEISRRSRLALAQSLEKGAEALNAMDGPEVLAEVQQAKNLAAALDLTHGWKAGRRSSKDDPGARPLLINLEILDLVVPPLRKPSPGASST